MQDMAAVLDQFGDQLHTYGRWRMRLAAAIQSYQEWYPAQSEPEEEGGSQELRMYELIESLRSDKLYVALVGEFSRGKTELINAIFFADYKRRLLPSTPGRTTMCPTEILWDPKFEPSIRLLPIETRKSALTISEYKKNPVNWTVLPLDLESADQMAETLAEIVKSKAITRQEAQEMGLLSAFQDVEGESSVVEVPVWRHAIVNYPHRLLKEGLVVLDTPGLNALGSEPELTLNLLPRAHAVLFVLAADTGVTKTDLEVWRNHVCVATHGHTDARIAALNKIDTLWDDLHSETEVSGYINRQAEETRRLLDIPRDMVFPVSAHKGLLGKIRRDGSLVARSGLPALEHKLSVDIVAYKQKLLKQKIVSELGSLVQSSRDVLRTRIDQLTRELAEVHSLRGRSNDVIQDMTDKLRRQKDLYEKEISSFQATRNVLSEQVRLLLHMLNMGRFDQLVTRARNSMQNSWTTPGLRQGMQTLFDGLGQNLETIQGQSDRIVDLVEDIYTRFHRDHGLPRMHPVKLSMKNFVRQFRLLYSEADAYRNSPAMMVVEQHYVIRKFFITLVSRARAIFEESNNSARMWAKAVLTPIHTQIQEHKIMIDRRLENLEKIRNNHLTLGERMRTMEKELKELQQRHAVVQNIFESLDDPDDAEVTRH